MHEQALAGQGMHVVDGVLVAQVPDGIEDEAMHRFKAGLLARVHATAPRGVVIDMSRVRLLDSASFEIVAAAGRMAAMLGPRVVYAGFQPGVVSALMDLDVDTSGLVTVLGLSEALELLHSARPRATGEGREDDPEGSAQDGPDAAAQDAPSGGEPTP
jgi:rsbT antagonist protein RsbS